MNNSYKTARVVFADEKLSNIANSATASWRLEELSWYKSRNK